MHRYQTSVHKRSAYTYIILMSDVIKLSVIVLLSVMHYHVYSYYKNTRDSALKIIRSLSVCQVLISLVIT